VGPQAQNPSASAPEWEALHQVARQSIHSRLRTLSAGTVEDLSREVLVTLFRLSRHARLVDPEALIHTLAHRVCVDHVRRQRGPSGRLDPVPDAGTPLEPASADAASGMPADMLELFRFLVLERFRDLDFPCQELAKRFYVEQSWSAVAEQMGLRHPTVIKRWARCIQQIRRLVRTQKGRLWEWARSVDRK
jgi:DNA-directed RNA polymerase specialized sigma24 family protein